MKNVIIMDISRINNKVWRDREDKKLKHFEQSHIDARMLPLQTIQQADVVIVTDRWNFKTLKCRVPEISEHELPLQYLDLTLALITKWQRE